MFKIFSPLCFFFKLRNPNTRLCIDTLGKDEKGTIPLSVYSCQNGVSANQYISLTKTDQLRREDECAVSMDSSSVVISSCSYGDNKQKWTHEKVEAKTNCFFLNKNTFLF